MTLMHTLPKKIDEDRVQINEKIVKDDKKMISLLKQRTIFEDEMTRKKHLKIFKK